MAPGYLVVSANGNPSASGECNNSGGLQYLAGTSSSAPIVAAMAALICQYFMEGWYPEENPVSSNERSLSGALVKKDKSEKE